MSSIPTFEAKLILDCNNQLGECPLYDDRRGMVCWVDIDGSKFWEYDILTKESQCYALPERAGSFALCSASTNFHLFAFENGPCFYNARNNTFLGKRIFPFELHLKTLPNDGRCDSNGRFVFGGRYEYDNKHPETKYNPISNIYRINSDGSVQLIISNIACANSICFNDDNGEYKMYVTDSRCWRPQQIKQYKYYDNDTLPSDPRVFTSWNEHKCAENAVVDGSIIDDSGFLWNAEYNGGRVVRYDRDGRIDMIIKVPEPYVTCCCFGGNNLDILFITTGGKMLTKKQKSKLKRNGGGLYAVQLPVKGKSEHKFHGTPYSTGCLSESKL